MRLLATTLSLIIALMPASVSASPFAIDVYTLQQPGIEIETGRPKTTYLEEGEPAPFAGTLLDPTATAQIVVERENATAQCQIEVQREVEVKRAEMQLKLDNALAAVEAADNRAALEAATRERQVESLSKDLERTQQLARRGRWNGAWFAGGVVAGVLVIIAGAFAVRGVREASL